MGRVGEVIIRTWQTAHKMKMQRGALAGEDGDNDNLAHQADTSQNTRSIPRSRRASAHLVGSVEAGKLADLVLWSPAFFGVKPDLVLKGGSIACALMGDPNASIPTPQPVHQRPMFATYGRALAASCVTFLSAAAIAEGVPEKLGLSRIIAPVRGTRNIGKSAMKLNDARPMIEVDPETYEVRADGELMTCEPMAELPLAQRYSLF